MSPLLMLSVNGIRNPVLSGRRGVAEAPAAAFETVAVVNAGVAGDFVAEPPAVAKVAAHGFDVDAISGERVNPPVGSDARGLHWMPVSTGRAGVSVSEHHIHTQ
jgi:hypothetical protein